MSMHLLLLLLLLLPMHMLLLLLLLDIGGQIPGLPAGRSSTADVEVGAYS